MHASIENYCARKYIFTQNQWCTLMAKATNDPYIVHQMKQEDIYNLSDFSELFTWKNVKIASLKEISVHPNSAEVSVKYDLDQPVATKFRVLKKGKGVGDIISHNLEAVNTKKIPLPPRKKADLTSMLDKELIPSQYIEDFKKILAD